MRLDDALELDSALDEDASGVDTDESVDNCAGRSRGRATEASGAGRSRGSGTSAAPSAKVAPLTPISSRMGI